MELDFHLHPAQAEIFSSDARFKVVAAGRRFGKSYLARMMMIIEALETEKDGKSLKDAKVLYVAPTLKQARDIMWNPLVSLVAPLAPRLRETDCLIGLPNGREIHLTGADRPDTMRGSSYSYVVMDEYAQMKSHVWSEILRPALSDHKGGALFIGTPAGKNHFYELFCQAEKRPDWDAFTYTTLENPHIDPSEVKQATEDMPAEFAAQEFRASFTASGGAVLKPDSMIIRPAPTDGQIYMTVDLSGFDTTKKRGSKTLDDTAICVTKVGTYGWHVINIFYGRWDVRETALRILKTAQTYRPLVVGIEKGPLKQAVLPYMTDLMRKIGVFPTISDLTHGNKNKQGRIQWALQGRLEQGRLTFSEGEYLTKLKEQMADFPNSMAHDDLIDALAYTDQVATAVYHDEDEEEHWEPLDAVAGY